MPCRREIGPVFVKRSALAVPFSPATSNVASVTIIAARQSASPVSRLYAHARAPRPLEADVGLIEADTHAFFVISTTSSPGSFHVVVLDYRPRVTSPHQRVVRINAVATDSALADVGAFVERRLLDCSLVAWQKKKLA